MQKPNFCMSPWVHLHVWPDSNVFPCCMTPHRLNVGKMSENSLKEIWNGPEMRRLRMQIIKGEQPEGCVNCRELEKSGALSMRSEFNLKYPHHFDRVQQTLNDGTAPDMRLAYVDIRFSNLCNFKCRTCGPELSSSWYEDQTQLNPEVILPKNRKLIERSQDLWQQFDSMVDHIEEINLVGGEPMLMEDHWRILAELDRRGRHDVRLRYNTNLSTLRFQNHDALVYWKKFKDVRLHISADGSHNRGELLRKGLRWEAFTENRKRLAQDVPHVSVRVNSTISNMNIHHILDFHREWVELGLIDVNQMKFSNVVEPICYRSQVLPFEYKLEVQAKAEKYLTELRQKYTPNKLKFVASQIQAMVDFMMAQDRMSEWPQFLTRVRRIDELRGESFSTVFPEMAPYLTDLHKI